MGFAFRCRAWLYCRCSLCARRRRTRSRRGRRNRHGRRRRRNPERRPRCAPGRPIFVPKAKSWNDPPAPNPLSPVRPLPVDPPVPQPVDPPVPQPVDPPVPQPVDPPVPQPVDPPVPQPVDPPVPQPVDPPVPQPFNPAFNTSCCGNILITGSAPSVLFWERDASLPAAVVQATVYAPPDNAAPLRLLIESDGRLELDVAPGNTVNYLGQGIRRLLATVPDAGPSTYAEGRYAVSVHR